MNDTVKKWNDYIISQGKYKVNINVRRYLIDNHMKIIDLKHLKEIGKDTMVNDVSNIMAEKLKIANEYTCLIALDKISDKECKSYSICFLCKLDYLISINRIKIINGNES